MHQFRCRVIGQYGTFTTAKVQPRKAGLVGHTLAEPQGIDQGSVFTLVGKDTTAAQRRAEFCAMDCNTTIKFIIITKYHHTFIAIDGNSWTLSIIGSLRKCFCNGDKFLDWQLSRASRRGLRAGCSGVHVRQPLQVINLLDEFLAKKVEDNTKWGQSVARQEGKHCRRWTLKPTMSAPLSGVTGGREPRYC